MEESYNDYLDTGKENYSEIRINIDNNYKNNYPIKTNSFFDFENKSNINEFNDFFGNQYSKYNYDNENENDISSEDEYESKLQYIKLGILTAKLNIFNKILYSKMQKYYYYFISKLKLKIKCNEIFNHGDNFLYSKLKPKTSEVKKYYAFKKLIYIFRKNKYEKLMKATYFNKWKIVKNYFLFNKKQKTNAVKIVKFYGILLGILNKRLDKEYQAKYYISKWHIISNYEDIMINKIRKAIILLSNLFSRKMRHILRKFPRNYLNLKNKSNILKKYDNNKQISYIVGNNEMYYRKGLNDFYDIKKKYKKLLKYNKLLKIIEKMDIKKRVDKNIYIFFNRLKNIAKNRQYKKAQIKQLSIMLNDIKYDSMLNAATLMKIILNNHINNDIFIYQKYFLQKLYTYNKFNQIFTQYKKDYKHIIERLNNNKETKEQIKNIRGAYNKIFALQKILILNNRHKFFYSDLNIQLKNSVLYKYFYLWKKITLKEFIGNYLKQLSSQKLFIILNDIYVNKLKRKIFFYIRKKAISKSFNDRKYYYFSYYIFYIMKLYIKKYILNPTFFLIKNIGKKKIGKNNELRIKIYLKLKKLFLIYKKYVNNKQYKYLMKWYFICSFMTKRNNIFKEKIKIISKKLDNSYNKKRIDRLFKIWKKKVFIFNEKNQINQVKINFFLNKFISTKSLMLKWLYFKKWLNTNNDVLNYEKLLNQLDQLRKDNDYLIAIYYGKRQEYAKTLYDYNYMKKYYCTKCINENEDEIDYMSLKSNDIREAGKMTTSMMISKNRIDISKDNSKNMKSKNFDEKDENRQNKISYGLSSDGNNFIVNEENKLQTSNSNIISLSDDDEMNSHLGKKIPQLTGENLLSKNNFEDENKGENKDDDNRKESIIKEYEKEYEEQQKYYENYIKLLLEKKNELIQMKNMLNKQRNESIKTDK